MTAVAWAVTLLALVSLGHGAMTLLASSLQVTDQAAAQRLRQAALLFNVGSLLTVTGMFLVLQSVAGDL